MTSPTINPFQDVWEGLRAIVDEQNHYLRKQMLHDWFNKWVGQLFIESVIDVEVMLNMHDPDYIREFHRKDIAYKIADELVKNIDEYGTKTVHLIDSPFAHYLRGSEVTRYSFCLIKKRA